MKTLCWLVTGILGAVVIGLIFITMSPGYDMSIVKSESMKPSINMGDMIITGPMGGWLGHDIKLGTIVSYQIGEKVVTHRVISVDNNALVTKGDAVEDPDPAPIPISQVEGVYLFKIPKLGYLSYFIHTKLGWFLSIIFPATVLVGFIIREIIKESLTTSESYWLYMD